MYKFFAKSIVLMAIMTISLSTAVYGQEEVASSPFGPVCEDNLYVTFTSAIGPVIPAYTKVEFVAYFKPEWVPAYDAEYRISTHNGFTYDINVSATPYTYPDFCNYYPINRIKSVEFRIYFGDGRYCSYHFSTYKNTYTACTGGVKVNVPDSPY